MIRLDLLYRTIISISGVCRVRRDRTGIRELNEEAIALVVAMRDDGRQTSGDISGNGDK